MRPFSMKQLNTLAHQFTEDPIITRLIHTARSALDEARQFREKYEDCSVPSQTPGPDGAVLVVFHDGNVELYTSEPVKCRTIHVPECRSVAEENDVSSQLLDRLGLYRRQLVEELCVPGNLRARANTNSCLSHAEWKLVQYEQNESRILSELAKVVS